MRVQWALLLALVPLVTAENVCEGEDICLLSLRHHVSRVGAAEATSESHFRRLFMEVKARRELLEEWTRATQRLRTNVFADPLHEVIAAGAMDKFIKNQDQSTDACHAKQLEAKRSLDGLLHNVKQLSSEIEAETAVVSSNTESLQDALDKKKTAQETQEQTNTRCDATAEEAKKSELGAINAELEEMKNIAKPEVRSRVATDVDYAKEAADLAEGERRKAEAAAKKLSDDARQKVQEGALSLAQTDQMALRGMNIALVVQDVGKCNAFKNALDRVDEAHQLSFQRADCDADRSELQKEFTKSYLAIADMYDRKAQEIKDELEECKTTSQTVYEEKDQVVTDEVKEATEAIAAAKDTIETLEPRLEEAKESVEKLRAHVKTMEDTCVIGGDVSEHLTNIRKLINRLEECPGKNDFTLDIPEWKAKVPTL